MATLKTYDLKGNKLSFANWISNLSPTETPFTAMIGKEKVDQTMYTWQTDRLSTPMNLGVEEGADFSSPLLLPTREFTNFTQILRKVVHITDTANRVGLYGRDSEKAYQMEKAGKEIRRDLEKMVLQNPKGTMGTKGPGGTPRTFSGFEKLVAPLDLPCPTTGAVVHKVHKKTDAADPAFNEDVIFDLTYNLYLAGSKANKIMVHPKHMQLFSELIGGNETNPGRPVHRMFDNVDTRFNAFVNKLRDPLGQEFTVIPNRHMFEDRIYFFNESDWTQMILREPQTVQLAKTGSSEKHMMEMEVGLRHRNPYASGVIVLKENTVTTKAIVAHLTHNPVAASTTANTKFMVAAYKDGTPDLTSTDKVTVDIPNGSAIKIAGITFTSNTGTFDYVNGIFSGDLSCNRVGTHPIRLSMTTGEEMTLILNVHSNGRMAVTLDEQLEEAGVEVPVSVKASKAKVKGK